MKDYWNLKVIAAKQNYLDNYIWTKISQGRVLIDGKIKWWAKQKNMVGKPEKGL